MKAWSYAIKAGDILTETWNTVDFENGNYHLRVYGPDGFYREFKGGPHDPDIEVTADVFKNTLRIRFRNNSNSGMQVKITDNSYGAKEFVGSAPPSKLISSYIDVSKSYGWYDISVTVNGNRDFKQTFAGRIENGRPGRTDPLMGRDL